MNTITLRRITLRRATEQDFAALDALYYATHEYHVAGVPERLRSLGPLEQWDRDRFHTALQKIFANEDACLWLAEVDGAPAGMIEAYLKSAHDDPVWVPRIFVDIPNLFVQPAFRKQGVGHQLIQAVEEWARDKGAAELCLSVWAFNTLAQRFYADMGFAPLKYSLSKKVQNTR